MSFPGHPAASPGAERRVLGVMSGTSLDGVDYAICKVCDSRVELVRTRHVPYARGLRRRIELIAGGGGTGRELCQLHHDLGRFYARHCMPTPDWAVDLAGLHGQTVFHRPHPTRPATVQIGEPAYLAARLGCPVASNFRAGDLAVGGQGAPLATLFHRHTFAAPGAHICVNNLGGISNVTSIDWRRNRSEPSVRAFDTGPANLPIDLAVQTVTHGRRMFDRGGKLAASGTVIEPVLAGWMRHPFLSKRPPKSTGREQFGKEFVTVATRQIGDTGGGDGDLIATLTEFSARSLALNYRKFLPAPPCRVILAGGGADNDELVARIGAALRAWSPGIAVETSRNCGWPPATIEPAAFALLADYRFRGIPSNFPETTGASARAVLGELILPPCGSNYASGSGLGSGSSSRS